jgi:ribosomal protein S1
MGGGGSTSSTESSEEVVATAPAVEVTADQLLSELEDNALSAKNNWDNKKVVITGTLDNIDASGNYFSLRGNNEFSFINVQVYIDDSFIDTVSAFKKGQTVTVTGEITDVGEIMGYSVDAVSIP